MAIWIYKKHPPHNLGGENYPHFQNKNQKLAWIKANLIDFTKPIDFFISRISFDTAILNLNLSGITTKNIAGIASSDGNELQEFWFVTGWNAGATKNTISFQLNLDYWLTYWPLSFNKSLVKIVRRHVDRIFWKDKTKQNMLNLNLKNRAFHLKEENYPPNIVQNKSFPVTISYFLDSKIVLMIGIVFTSTGGSEDYDLNYYIKNGINSPGNQNGWLIFAPINNQAINDWLSFPGITQTFYFFMDENELNKVKNKEEFTKFPQTNDYRGVYSILKKDDLDFKRQLNVIAFEELGDGGGAYVYFVFQLAQLIYLSYQFAPYTEKSLLLTRDIFIIDKNYKIKYDVGINRPNLQLFSLKSFFKNNELKLNSTKTFWKNQFIRRTEGLFFTTLNIFNEYFNYRLTQFNNRFSISIDIDKIYNLVNFVKDELWNYQRDLKIINNLNFYLCYQNKFQEFKFWWNDWRDLYIYYIFSWIITLQNSYLSLEPNGKSFINLKNKKYNFVVANETKLPNYTDQSIEFYQKQGISFETGINQAKYQLNWLKRYQQFQNIKFPYQQITGFFKGLMGDAAAMATAAAGARSGKITTGQAGGASLGLIFDAVDRGINTAFNFKEFHLSQELKLKNAMYSLKSMLANQADIFNQPATTHSVENVEFNYWLISKKCLPYVMTLAPVDFDWKAQALIYHKNGYLNDQNEIIDFNKNTRRCWNFWEIHNIEQAIIKDNLNHMIIAFFNYKFNQGIRLWNVFYDEVKFNDYSLENWEQGIL